MRSSGSPRPSVRGRGSSRARGSRAAPKQFDTGLRPDAIGVLPTSPTRPPWTGHSTRVSTLSSTTTCHGRATGRCGCGRRGWFRRHTGRRRRRLPGPLVRGVTAKMAEWLRLSESGPRPTPSAGASEGGVAVIRCGVVVGRPGSWCGCRRWTWSTRPPTGSWSDRRTRRCSGGMP
jgi:hypothetical protein